VSVTSAADPLPDVATAARETAAAPVRADAAGLHKPSLKVSEPRHDNCIGLHKPSLQVSEPRYDNDIAAAAGGSSSRCGGGGECSATHVDQQRVYGVVSCGQQPSEGLLLPCRYQVSQRLPLDLLPKVRPTRCWCDLGG
jgi:hypothetical protein